jgi:hypothetical protein
VRIVKLARLASAPRPSLAGAAALVLLAALGCQQLNTPIYFNGPDQLNSSGAGTPLMPSLDKKGLLLRFRNPTAGERQDLDARAAALGFGVPWVPRDRVHIQLTYDVQNVDSAAGTFNVMVDGGNEFSTYDMDLVAALFTAKNQPPVFLPLIESRPHILGPGQSYQGIMREDDFVEAELDLDALGRWMAPFAAVLINRSDVDPTGLFDDNGNPRIPAGAVIPAMTEIDVTLLTDKHMTCTYLVRVRDDDDRLLHDSGDTLFTPAPVLYQPMLPPPN